MADDQSNAPETSHNHQRASDDEDAALSPADGYFHNSNTLSQVVAPDIDDDQSRVTDGRETRGPLSANVPHVPNVLVEDPTLRQTGADAKAQEAADEASGANPQNDQASPDQEPDQEQEQEQTHDNGSSQPQEVSSSAAPVQTPTTIETGPGPTDQAIPPRPSSPSPPPSPLSPRPPRRLASENASLLRGHHRGHRGNRGYADAPPAYSRNPPASYQSINPNASTASIPSENNAYPGEEEPLLSTDPQAMSVPFPEPELPVSLVFWRRFSKVTERPRYRKRIVLILAAILILVVMAIVAITYVMSNHHKHDYVEEPVKPPDAPEDGEFHWNPPKNCRQSEHSHITGRQTYTFSEDKDFTILEVASQEDSQPASRRVHVFGDMFIQPSTGSSYSTGSILVESIANQEELGPLLGWDRSTRTFKLTTPREIHWDDRDSDPCMQVRITMFVPQDAVLNSLSLQSQNLNIKVHEGLALSVMSHVDVLTMAGDVIFPTRQKNETLVPYRLETSVLTVQATAGNLRGWFPIYDTLVLATHSGNVNANVSQKLPKYPKATASKLGVKTHTGHVTISESHIDTSSGRSRLREHQVAVEGDTGNTDIETLFASMVLITSQSGNIRLNAWPASDSDCVRWGHKFCLISTETKSGSTAITINPPRKLKAGSPDRRNSTFDDSTSPFDTQVGMSGNLTKLQSEHASTTGKITAKYPQAWQGTVIGSTLTGNLSYSGKDLIMKKWDAVNKRLKGVKGEGDSVLVVSTLSGDQDVLVGDEEDA